MFDETLPVPLALRLAPPAALTVLVMPTGRLRSLVPAGTTCAIGASANGKQAQRSVSDSDSDSDAALALPVAEEYRQSVCHWHGPLEYQCAVCQ